ncbi:hypothetical protein OF83DRAFT_278132 [Amylostereum chailletii]|nr:hypothetical protein OF83DRAFT_278132 [Amylostereum chailletii]
MLLSLILCFVQQHARVCADIRASRAVDGIKVNGAGDRSPQPSIMTTAILAGLATLKLGCVCFGLCLREYVGNVAYDLEYMVGKRPRRWTTWIYLSCRMTTLAGVTMVFAALNIRYHVHCQLATVIIVLRIVVVWNHRTQVTLFALATWLTTIPFFIRDLIATHSIWTPEVSACIVMFNSKERDLEVVTICTDFVLVLLMLSGLVRKSQAGPLDLWGILTRQAFVWLGLTILAEVPTVVLMSTPGIYDSNVKVVSQMHFPICLEHASGLAHQIFWVPKILIISTGATRMYRALTEFIDIGSGYRMSSSSFTASDFGPILQNPTRENLIPPMEITVHTEYMQVEEEPDAVTKQAIRKAMKKDGARHLTKRDLEFL